MDTLLDLCEAVLLLTGGFLVITIWLIFIVLFVVELHDRIKEKNRPEED
jgi:hypothetical protein